MHNRVPTPKEYMLAVQAFAESEADRVVNEIGKDLRSGKMPDHVTTSNCEAQRIASKVLDTAGWELTWVEATGLLGIVDKKGPIVAKLKSK